MLALQAAGRKPGEDFAIIGFDDISEASLWQPPLTTIGLNPRGIGQAAADLLLERIHHPEEPSRQILLPVQLMVRGSCCTIT